MVQLKTALGPDAESGCEETVGGGTDLSKWTTDSPHVIGSSDRFYTQELVQER